MFEEGIQLVKLFTRGAIAAVAITGAALVAAGCGGGSSDDPAKNSNALDHVPATAIGYVAIDTDIEGASWENFAEVYPAFNAKFKDLDTWVDSLLKGAKGDVTYADDIEPWLGDSAGLAVLTAKGAGEDGTDPGLLAWVELNDAAAFEKFAKSQGFKEGSKVDDYTLWSKGADTVVGVSDKLALLAQSKKALTAAINYDGDSIADAPGVDDSIDKVGKDALATVVLGGKGIRKAVKDASPIDGAGDIAQLKALQAGAASFSAHKDGLRVDGYVASDGEDLPENDKNDVFNDMPGNTVLAFGGNDLGGGLGGALDDAGKDNAQIQQGVGAISGVLGVTVDDIAKGFGGQFALGVSSDDQGLGALAGGVTGAAMGGGYDASSIGSLLKAGSVTLAFEETGKAQETLDKVVSGIGGLTGSTAAPKTGTSGDFKTKQVAVQGVPVTVAASDEVAAVSIGVDVFSAWGDDTLGDNDAFQDAWKAADAPKETLGLMWADYPRVAALANLKGAEGTEAGGWVGWIESDKDDASFSVFMYVPET